MTWTPELLARLKALRDKAIGIPTVLNWREYERVLSDADPLSRIEELKREIERLKAQRDTAYGYGRDGGEPPWMK